MTINGNKATALRIINAENAFAETLCGLAGISTAEAFKAIAVLRKAKAIKVDPVIGRMIVKHGAFMNADVIRRAVAMG